MIPQIPADWACKDWLKSDHEKFFGRLYPQAVKVARVAKSVRVIQYSGRVEKIGESIKGTPVKFQIVEEN